FDGVVVDSRQIGRSESQRTVRKLRRISERDEKRDVRDRNLVGKQVRHVIKMPIAVYRVEPLPLMRHERPKAGRVDEDREVLEGGNDRQAEAAARVERAALVLSGVIDGDVVFGDMRAGNAIVDVTGEGARLDGR